MEERVLLLVELKSDGFSIEYNAKPCELMEVVEHIIKKIASKTSNEPSFILEMIKAEMEG